MDFDQELAQLERMKLLLIEILELKKKIAEYDKPAHVCPPCPYPHYWQPGTVPFGPNVTYTIHTVPDTRETILSV